MSDATLKIILALITLLGVIITNVLVPWIKGKTSKEQRDNLTFWVKTAVMAIEKYYENQGHSGLLKKSEVIDFIVSQGFDIEDEQLSLLIDAVVEEIVNKPAKELKVLSSM